MKKIVFLMIAVSLSPICIGQQLIQFKDVVNVNLPDKAARVEKKDVAVNFENRGFDMDAITYNTKDIFRVDDMLVTFHFDHVKVKADYLKNIDGWRSNYTHNASYLKTINNNQILVVSNQLKNSNKYLIYTVNHSHTAMLNASIEYSPGDSTKGKELLNNILQNIKYSNE